MTISKRKEIQSKQAPVAIGCYSQAVQVDNLLFLSGQIGLDPQTQLLVTGGVEAQLRQVFSNLAEVLKSAGAGFDQVVKLTVYLKNLQDFSLVNEVMREYFSKPYPARAAVEIAGLPKGALVEIDGIAAL